MINYKQSILQSRINVVIGAMFIGSWALGCGLLVWRASFDTDPLTVTFESIIHSETQGNF